MIELNRNIRFSTTVHKKEYIFIGCVTLFWLAFSAINAIKLHIGFNPGKYLFSCTILGIMLGLPYNNQKNIFSYLVGSGETRSIFLKVTILKDSVLILLLSFIACFGFGIIDEISSVINGVYTAPVSVFISYNLQVMIQIIGYGFIVYGLSSFIISIFFSKGAIIGSSSVFIILALLVQLKDSIINQVQWDYTNSIAISLLIIAAGVFLKLGTWYFIKDAELKY